MCGLIFPRVDAIRFTLAALVAAVALSTPAAAAVKSVCGRPLHYCTGKCHIGDRACFNGCYAGYGCPRPSGGQTQASVKSRQPPSVWSGSTNPTAGTKSSKGGPIH